ncbi:MAG: hypothetical protein M3R08_03000, partial [Bacteroidota bacterium]|nr:hypothetical protein [Bacteroidota bacterium]
MITRKHLRLDLAIRYSWKNILYSALCWGLAYSFEIFPQLPVLRIPISIVGILGTAVAIILGFRNSSAYERWWEARIIWGGILNESRTLTRQLTTFCGTSVDPIDRERIAGIVRLHIAWVNALRLQLRDMHDPRHWQGPVYKYLQPAIIEVLQARTNKATILAIEMGRELKQLHSSTCFETLLFVQLDNTMSRLTELQGRAERIKTTPLPRPYDYYTLAFLNIFILFFPFGVRPDQTDPWMQWVMLPITIVVGWIFYQIYVFGKVLSHPFQNWRTDVPIDSISNTI